MIGATIGAIELGYDRVRVAVVRAGGKHTAVLELAETPVDFESSEGRAAALAHALGSMLDSLKERPQAYVLCASSLFTVARTLSIPFRGARRVASAVPFELEPYLAFPIEDLAVDFTTVGEFEGETEVLAMGMRRQHLDEQLDILREAGIDTDAATIDALALTGLWAHLAKPGKGLDAVLHVRAEGSILAVLSKGRLAYFRTLACTGDTVVENPGVAAREVNNTLRAFLAKWRGEGDITRLAVTGMDFTHEQRETFASAVGLPIDDLMMMAQLDGGALALANGPSGAKLNQWEPLVGAALGATGAGFSADFSQGAEQGAGVVRSVVSHLLFTACLGLIFLAGWAFYYYQGRVQNNAQATAYQAQAESLQKEIEVLTAQGPGDVDMTIFTAPDLLMVFQELSSKLPDDKVHIVDVKMMPPGARNGWLNVSGTATDAAAFNEAYAKLKESTLFKVDEQPSISVQGTQTTFSFRANRIEEHEEAHEPATT